jgi:hypothetical protein
MLQGFIITALLLAALILFFPVPVRFVFLVSRKEKLWEVRIFRRTLLKGESESGKEDSVEAESPPANGGTERGGAPENEPVEEIKMPECNLPQLETPVDVADSDAQKEEQDEEYIAKKKSDREFFSVILSPDFTRGILKRFWKLCRYSFKLFHCEFEDVTIEGVRLDYVKMGYLQGACSFISGLFPLFRNWNVQMDWCRSKEKKAHGIVLVRFTVLRVLIAAFGAIALGLWIFWKYRRGKRRYREHPETLRLVFWRRFVLDFLAPEK